MSTPSGTGQRARDVLLETLERHGAKYVFGNPGTTENPLLDGLAAYPGIRYVTALHEAVAVFAALAYAGASGECAVVNLHAAPGLGNAIGAIYAALKARAPVVITAGQQDTRMLVREPLLSHDLVAMARPVTKWAAQAERPDDVAAVMHRAFAIAREPAPGPVFVSLPIDVLESPTNVAAIPPRPASTPQQPAASELEAAAAAILAARRPAIIAGDGIASGGAVEALVAFAELIGAGVHWENLRVHCPFPNQHPNARGALPLDAEGMRRALGDSDLVVSVGGATCEEVWFTPGARIPGDAALLAIAASPAEAGSLAPGAQLLVGPLRETLAAVSEEVRGAAPGGYLEDAAIRNGELARAKAEERAAIAARTQKAAGRWPLPPVAALDAIARALPEGAVVVDESVSANVELGRVLTFATAGDYYGGRGGGIGQGFPAALGVQLAHPGRPVVAVSGDGSAMYGIQALWTAARYDLPIVFVVLANGEYRVLKHNLDTFRQRFAVDGTDGYPEMNLRAPALDFVEMARGMGIEGWRPAGPAEAVDCLRAAIASRQPCLVELPVEGKA